MPDRCAALMPFLRENRIPGLNLSEEFIQPAYQGQSSLNIPASICHWLDVPAIANLPLRPEIFQAAGAPYRQVVLLVVDALALHRFQRWVAEGIALWPRLIEAGQLSPLTAITPSTTAAALTTLWTGRGAVEHGITGYEMWLREYGMVANAITHAPMSFAGEAGSLARAGFTPEAFLPLPTLSPHLAAHGVKSVVFQHYGILQSGLSSMFFRDVERQGFFTPTDLCLNLREWMERHTQERQYLYVYWSEVDTFSHRYGPDDDRTVQEFAAFSQTLERLLFSQLSDAARRETLFVLTADHGQITTPPDPYYDLRNHPGLTRRLHMQPTGENRLVYLFIRPGQTEAVREYIQRTWPNQFVTLDPAYAVQMGLFGPGEPHPGLLDRIGDLILVAHGGAYLWWAKKENVLRGRHGGLHPEEMLVPLLTVPL